MSDFVFADEYRLAPGPTREFFGDFLKGYIHKHNNLMGVVQGFSSLILYDGSINAEVRESGEQIQNSSKLATNLNHEILGATGFARCEIAPTRLGEILPYWESKSAEICAASSVGFSLKVEGELPTILADSTRLGELYFHLLRNAAEASAEFPGSSVSVNIFPPGTASQGNTVDLFIRNRSVDFDLDGLRRCFRPFETTKGTDQFGIGLTSAAVIAGDMNMRLGLRNAEGTMTAWVAIPVAG